MYIIYTIICTLYKYAIVLKYNFRIIVLISHIPCTIEIDYNDFQRTDTFGHFNWYIMKRTEKLHPN